MLTREDCLALDRDDPLRRFLPGAKDDPLPTAVNLVQQHVAGNPLGKIQRQPTGRPLHVARHDRRVAARLNLGNLLPGGVDQVALRAMAAAARHSSLLLLIHSGRSIGAGRRRQRCVHAVCEKKSGSAPSSARRRSWARARSMCTAPADRPIRSATTPISNPSRSYNSITVR